MDVIIGAAARRDESASAATVAPSHAGARPFTAALWGRLPTTMAAADRSANTVYTSVGGKPQLLPAIMEDAREDPAIAETLTAVAGPRIPARSSGWRTWGCSGREMDAVAGSSASPAQDA
jgi:hypothetical protein